MVRILICILLSTTSCQKAIDWIVDETNIDKDPRTFKGVHPDLQEYVTRFTEDSSRAVVDVPITIRDLDPNAHLQPEDCKTIPGPWSKETKEYCYQSPNYAAAICFMQKTPIKWYKWIIVDQEWWDRFKHDDVAIEQMMYHELGHCVLGKDHVEGYTVDEDGYKRPNSIMRSSLFSKRELLYYELHKETIYIPELVATD